MAYTKKSAIKYLEDEFKKKAQEAAAKAKEDEKKKKSTNVSTGGTTSHKGGQSVKASQSNANHKTNKSSTTYRKSFYEDLGDSQGDKTRHKRSLDASTDTSTLRDKQKSKVNEDNERTSYEFRKVDEDSFKGRASNVTHGSAKQFAGAQISSAGTALQEKEVTARSYNKARAEAETPYYDLRTRETAEKNRDSAIKRVNLKENVDIQNAERVFDVDPNGMASRLIRTGDALQESGQKDIERAKQGLGTLGNIAVDISSNALMMAGDGLMNLVAPGLGLASLGNRAGGMASYEGRIEGMNADQQYLYALSTSAIEMLSEQIGNGVSAFRGIYGKGAIDVADSITQRMATSSIVQKVFRNSPLGRELAVQLAKFGINFAEEGFEEVIADIAEPAMKYAITKSTGGEYDPTSISEMLYDFLIGGLMTVGGGSVDVVRNTARAMNKPAMLDGAATVESIQAIKNASAQNEGTLANYLGTSTQEILDKGGVITASQINRMKQATLESQLENEEARINNRNANLEAARSRGEIEDLKYQGTRAESYEEKRYNEVMEQQANELVDAVEKTMGEEPSSKESVMSVARALTGNASTMDIDTILSDNMAKKTYEKMSGMKLSSKNSEARSQLETQSNINEIANSNSALQMVWNDDAEAITKALSENIKGTGKQVFMENLAKGEEAVGKANYSKLFDKIYMAGTISGMKVEDAMHMVDTVFAGKKNSEGKEFFTEARVKEIFMAGRADTPDIRAEGTTLKSSKRKSRAKGKVQYGRNVKNSISAPIQAALEKIAENGGITIKVVDRIETNNPNAHANGKYENGVIYLAADSSNPLVTVAKHELTHWIKEHNLDAYKKLEDFIFEEMYKSDPDKLQDRINYYTGLYSNLSIQEVKEEIIADMSEAFFTDEGTIKEVVNYNKSLGRTIKEGIQNLLKGFSELAKAQENGRYRGYGNILKDLDILVEAQSMWAEALEGARKDDGNAKPLYISNNEMNANLHEVHKMKPVGRVEFNTSLPVSKTLSENVETAFTYAKEKIGLSFYRDDVGKIEIDESGFKDVFRHNRKDLKMSTLDIIPYVLGKGKVVAADIKHRGKPFNTVTFVAPIHMTGSGFGKYDVAGDYYAAVTVKRFNRLTGIDQNLHVTDVMAMKKGSPNSGLYTHAVHGLSDGESLNLRTILQYVDADVNIFKDSDEKILYSLTTKEDQQFTSADTSINSSKVPAVFNKVDWKKGTVNVDIGGGRFDTAQEFLKPKGVENLVYDPYNRSKAHNQRISDRLDKKKADTATISNVLNVIQEKDARIEVLNNAKENVKPNGEVYITVYEGNGSGIGAETSKGYQLNMKLKDYLTEVQEVFPDAYIRRGMIVAPNTKSGKMSLSPKDSNGNKLSKGQQEFFKDSKVRDENGNLLVMYHGTEGENFTVFDPEYSKDGLSLFFTDSLTVAKGYSGTRRTYKPKARSLPKTSSQLQRVLNLDSDFYEKRLVEKTDTGYVVNLYGRDENDKFTRFKWKEYSGESIEDIANQFYEEKDYDEGSGSRNYKVYLNITNPLIVDADGRYWDELDELNEGLSTTREYAEYAKENGYDGVWFKNIIDTAIYASNMEKFEPSNVVVAFDSSQVKSVANQNPTSDPDIRFSYTEKEELNTHGADVTEGGSVVKYSIESWAEADQEALVQKLIAAGYEEKEARAWVNNLNSISALLIGQHMSYKNSVDRTHSALKNNQEYIHTLDLSTLCAKRRLYQGTFNAIMHSKGMENKALLPKDVIHLRALMNSMGYEVPCGICYEESRKKNEPKYANNWLNGDGKWKGYANMGHDDPYIPTLADVLTTDGRAWLREYHPEALDSYLTFQKTRGNQNPKVSLLHTDYRSEILNLTQNTVNDLNHIGGLRIQSFSDFEIPHVLDMMQAALDMSAMGLKSQAYTKVPEFAEIFGNTGIKINLSLIGHAVNGKLVFDNKEGINYEEAFRLREKYDQNVGTIIVGANKESILLAWADDRIDMVIPFHRSGWSTAEFEALGLGNYEDFQNQQTERYILSEEEATTLTEKEAADPKKKRPKKYKAGDTITLAAAMEMEFVGKTITINTVNGAKTIESKDELYSNDYWDSKLSGKENAKIYLKLCAELHRRPVFYEFLHDNGDGSWSLKDDGKIQDDGTKGPGSTDGYWKSLIDFKMYDSNGNFAPQEVVKPNFNMDAANEIINNFGSDPEKTKYIDNLPVADDVVEQFVKDYLGGRKYKMKDDKPNAKIDLPKVTKKAKMSLSETDKTYIDAVNKGDMKTAQKMVDEAAKKAGYTFGKVYHGTPNNDFTVFKNAIIFFTSNEDTASEYKDPGVMWATAYDKGRTLGAYIKLDNPLMLDNSFSDYRNEHTPWQEWKPTVYGRVPENAMSATEVAERAKAEGYDGVFIANDKDTKWTDSSKYLKNRGRGDTVIAFNSTQVKSADPVTYDDEGNVIPLSQRFNTKNDDIRYQLTPKETTAEEKSESVDELHQKIAKLKGEFKRTDLMTPKEDQTRIQASKLLRRYESNLAVRDNVVQTFNQLFKLYKQGKMDSQEAIDIAKEQAKQIVDNVSARHEEGRETFEAIKEKLKEYRIGVTPEMKSEIPDYNAFARRNRARLRLYDTLESNIESIYGDLRNDFNTELLPEANHPGEMLQNLSSFLDTKGYTYEQYNSEDASSKDFVDDVAYDLMVTAAELQTKKTFADRKYEEKVRAVRKEREKAQRLKRETTYKYEKKIADLKEHQKEVRQAKRERRAESEDRTKLLNIARRLDKVKTNTPTKKLIEEFIGDLDLVAKSMTGKTLQNLNELQDWYDEQRELDPFFSDKNIEKKLNRIGRKQIAEMDINDVRELTTILKSIEASIRNGNKFVDSSYKHTMKEAGLEVMKNINKSVGLKRNSALGKLDSFFINETLSPVRQIHRITGYVDDDPLYIATQELADGQREMMTYEMNAWNMFTKFTEDKKFVESLNGKKARPIQLMAMRDGQTVLVKVTPDVAISLYLSCKNEDNMNHIGNGGVNIPDFELYRKGDLTEAYENSTRFTFSKEMLDMIESRLTTKEKALADTAYKYFNETAPEAINRVSNILKGYDIATVKNYFPIMTDKNFLTHDFESLKFDGTIEGMGSLKERVHADNPVEINGIVDTLTRSIKENSMYVGLAIPVRNMNKLLGVKDITWTEKDRGGKLDNNLRMELHATYNGSVEESIRKKWGQPAMKYIENFMTDLQTSRTKRDDWVKRFNALRSNYAGAVLTFNASVAVKQAASYPTAAAVIGTAPLIRAMGNVGKVDLDLIAKYTPLQWYRSKGFSTVELGDIRAGRKGSLVDKATSIPALNWIQSMDILTTRKLWKASEYYVQMHNKNLEVGSDEYYKVVADVYNRVIEETQPNYATMQRPGLLRSEDSLVQTLNMFKTQPYQNFNILYDAIGNYVAKANVYKETKSEESRAAAREAAKEMQKAATSQFMQLAVFAAMGFAWAFFRGRADKWKDEEEDKVTINSFLQRLGIEMISGSAAMFPFGADLLSAFSPDGLFQDYYYGFSSTTDSAINDFLSTIRDFRLLMGDLYEYATIEDKEGYDTDALLKQVETVIKEWGRFSGLPVDNLKKTFDATYRWAMITANGKYVGEYLAANETLQKDSVKKAILLRAYQHDKEQYEELRTRMIEDGFDEKKLDDYIKKNGGANTVEKELPNAKDFPKAGKPSVYNKSMETLESSSFWDATSDGSREYYDAVVQKLSLGVEDKQTGYVTQWATEGLTNEQIILYKLALKKADAMNNNNGSSNKAEREAALQMFLEEYDLTPEQIEVLSQIK